MRREDWTIVYIVATIFVILLICWWASDYVAWQR